MKSTVTLFFIMFSATTMFTSDDSANTMKGDLRNTRHRFYERGHGPVMRIAAEAKRELEEDQRQTSVTIAAQVQAANTDKSNSNTNTSVVQKLSKGAK